MSVCLSVSLSVCLSIYCLSGVYTAEKKTDHENNLCYMPDADVGIAQLAMIK